MALLQSESWPGEARAGRPEPWNTAYLKPVLRPGGEGNHKQTNTNGRSGLRAWLSSDAYDWRGQVIAVLRKIVVGGWQVFV